jgi:hypothetical protein
MSHNVLFTSVNSPSHILLIGCVGAGLDMIALNEADGSASDATDLDTAAHGAGDQRSRMPAWAHALVDQVAF